MKYTKNTTMEFLDIDDENIVIYDPDSGDTHYISDTGKSILSLIDGEAEADDLIAELCKIYSAEKSEIEADVREFLGELADKKIIVAL